MYRANPWKAKNLPADLATLPQVAEDAGPVLALLSRCPAYRPTPLLHISSLGASIGGARLCVKDETARMGLGSFKALGAAYAIARDAVAAAGDDNLASALAGRTYVTASAGNHGMSVAAGARVFGAHAVIFISETVPDAIAERLRGKGARVIRQGHDYEASMAAAAKAADANGWTLLSDSTWPGYTTPALDVMAGYLALAEEIVAEMVTPPTHVFLQAGVGGFAAAMLARFRNAWGRDGFEAIVVEPAFARCIMESLLVGRAVRADGPVSAMGRLDCKEPSHVALATIARLADGCLTVTEEEAAEAASMLATVGIATTPSGAAGFAGAIGYENAVGGLGPDARVLAVVTEGT